MTNHNSLKYFLDQKELNERQQKWVSKVQAYDFEIEYVKGVVRRLHTSSINLPKAVSSLEKVGEV